MSIGKGEVCVTWRGVSRAEGNTPEEVHGGRIAMGKEETSMHSRIGGCQGIRGDKEVPKVGTGHREGGCRGRAIWSSVLLWLEQNCDDS